MSTAGVNYIYKDNEELDMCITLRLSSAEFSEPKTDTLTRQLLREIRIDADPKATLTKQPGNESTKGDSVLLGQIALALVTSGTVTALINCIFEFLNRNKKIKISIKKPDGSTLDLDAEYVSKTGTDGAFEVLRDFLRQAD
ncbi:hypothetical protein [Paraburkholderia caledonica]|uniref:hypothetical protein n=1 Tax=Paraburkholderia caledonica TaxID=134536 RepID=UPI000B40421F|nr:hypothetical protein [Paraburkholderia caledonica]